SVEEINLGRSVQVRAEVRDDKIEEYGSLLLNEGPDALPPVDLYRVGDRLILGDGFHRVHGARRKGVKTIKAIIHDGDADAALLFAVGANSTHGLPRTNADKRRAVKLVLGKPE